MKRGLYDYPCKVTEPRHNDNDNDDKAERIQRKRDRSTFLHRQRLTARKFFHRGDRDEQSNEKTQNGFSARVRAQTEEKKGRKRKLLRRKRKLRGFPLV